ncbi:MAG: hypothetical protein WC889_02795 [Myxococcota bacterium]|jgi:hypothetical protein
MSILSKIAAGANKFSNELLLPTNGLGKLGAYLSAAADQPLGLAAMAAMRDQRNGADTELERQIKEMRLKQMMQPPQPGNDYERIVARLGQEAADKYLATLAAGPPISVDTLDPVSGQTIRQLLPRSSFTPPSNQPPVGSVIPDPRKPGGAPQPGARPFR